MIFSVLNVRLLCAYISKYIIRYCQPFEIEAIKMLYRIIAVNDSKCICSAVQTSFNFFSTSTRSDNNITMTWSLTRKIILNSIRLIAPIYRETQRAQSPVNTKEHILCQSGITNRLCVEHSWTLETSNESRCPTGVNVSCLASRTGQEYLRHNK